MKKTDVANNEKGKGISTILFDLFRSLKLTIFLLILLAIISIIGTLITQGATAEEYVQRYGLTLYEVLDFFNLFDMYHSWWFSAILLVLVINLIACSIHRLPGVLSQLSRKPGATGLEDSMIKVLPYVEKVIVSGPAKGEEEIRRCLQKRFGVPERFETPSAITLYSEKGKFSRLGVPLSHLSIIIILVGAMVGSIYGFKGFVNILEGETIDKIYQRGKDREIARPLGFSVLCDDFKLIFYDLPGKKERHVKEYVSVLTILENGGEVLKETVRVNHPLHYKGLAFYQSSYGALHDLTLGVQWKGQKEKTLLRVSEGETTPIPNSPFAIRVLKYAHEVENFGEGVQVVLFKPNQQPRVFWLLKNFPEIDQKRADEFVLTLEEVLEKEYTGLQVAKDPGVWIVWAGCGLMILGLIISFFFSHQRVWVRITRSPSGGAIVVAGSTSKNRIGFEKTFADLAGEVRSASRK
ncbi:MAG: cytochrome c biogenesis protein ResB [Deltaproteobacteria bacterium]|nr:MAG: cytochrome c biogenesis protein ResB [Deltaproteobacteria bacterium]